MPKKTSIVFALMNLIIGLQYLSDNNDFLTKNPGFKCIGKSNFMNFHFYKL
jgi:hypothetical protein